ncbi:YlcI/YnfO family protein [Variovorax sp. EBFNA2]|uniref:YlcI/YnfO family protein n=1 Tax=Variovorax sp. EBFNA2 TaxID=3342097 RepID=UPI0029BFE942|nr:YlcI/YnfO family protein [Variovorax boronicumulans]WPG41252.1 YlcI/YnfO family protein [Variovorax boronicumulans]
MKTAQLPPIRVTAAVREQIEGVLLEGETLSHFVEQAATDAARRRKAQQDFVARGRASLAHALESGESYVADDVLDAMKSRIDIARKAAEKGRGGISKRRA